MASDTYAQPVCFSPFPLRARQYRWDALGSNVTLSVLTLLDNGLLV